jgi:transcriptional regulator with XRE-family HTH domain
MGYIEMLLDLRKYLTRKELAKLLETSETTITYWLKGVNDPCNYHQQKILNLFNNDLKVFKQKYYKNREKNYIKYLNKRRRKF